MEELTVCHGAVNGWPWGSRLLAKEQLKVGHGQSTVGHRTVDS